MRKIHKLAALCAVFFMMLSFGIVAYAEEAPTETQSTESTTVPPAESPAPDDKAIADLLPPGTGTVVDVFTGEDGRKFYTIQTPAGNTFYLIIDFSKQGDNVYFLDAVAEKDLLALAEKEGGESVTPNKNSQPTSEPTQNNQTEPKQETENNNMFRMALVVLVVLIGGGVGIYFKVIRKKQTADSRDEYEADDDYEENIPEYGAEPEDDSPPWEDDNV